MALSLSEFDNLLADSLSPFVQLGNAIGGLVSEQANIVNSAFQAQRAFIEYASQSAKPSNDSDLMKLLKPTSDLLTRIQDIREKNRKHEQFNHLSAVSEGISALGWVTVSPTPAPYVKEMCDSAQFYTNKILVNFKDKPDQAQNVEWAKAWIAFLTALQQFIRKHHTTGLVWASVSSSSAPPPPPPPCNLNLSSSNSSGSQEMNDARAALFASINQGADITKSLRKVNKSEMTHNNPNLRAAGTVPEREIQNLSVTPKKAPTKGPEKFVLEGKKWLVENMTNRKDLVISDTHISQSVSVYQCDQCVLFVKGKINSITVDKCSKFSIVFDAIVSFVEFINSKSIQAQAMQVVPTVTMDCVDGLQLYLSPHSLQVEIVSSKSCSINVSVLNTASGDYVEHAIPEQLKSLWDEKSKSFKTVAVDKN